MTRLRFLVACCALWMALADCVRAEPEAVQVLQPLLNASTIPTLGYAVLQDGQIVEQGLLSNGGNSASNGSFRFGSLSKTATTLMILSLVEDGRLSLDMPVVEVLPDLRISNRWSDTAPLRLIHLLEQTSGLPGTAYADYRDVSPDFTATAYAQSRPHDLRWPPGRYFSYANGNHTLAAAVAEAVTGQRFDELMRVHVFDPLGMANTSFDLSDPRVQPVLQSVGTDGRQQEPWQLSVRPSGAMVGPVRDVAQLLRFLATGDAETPPVSQEALRRMRSPQTSLAARDGYELIYGAGLFGFVAADHIFWGHWGRIDGFQTTLGTIPEQRAGFLLVANGADRSAFHQMREALAAHVAADIPPLPAVTTVEYPGELGQFAGWWVPFTDDSVLRNWISEMLGLTRIRTTGDGTALHLTALLTGAARLEPLGGTQFRQEGFQIPTHVFSRTPEGEWIMLGDQQLSFRQVSPIQAHAMRFGFGAVTLAIALSLLTGLWIGIQQLRGRPAPSHAPAGLLVLAAMCFLSMLALFALCGLFGSLADLHLLATASPRSLILAGLSVVWPMCVLWAAYLLIVRRHRMARGSLLYCSAVAVVLIVAAAYLFSQGWMPLVTWQQA